MKSFSPRVKLIIVKIFASPAELELIEKLDKGERDFTLMGSTYLCQKYKTQRVTLHNPTIKTHIVTIHAVRTF